MLGIKDGVTLWSEFDAKLGFRLCTLGTRMLAEYALIFILPMEDMNELLKLEDVPDAFLSKLRLASKAGCYLC